MGKQALKGRRRQAFMLAPEDLTLVTDRKHPLYDERVHLPLDEGMIASIMAIGVKVAIKVRKNGPLVEVVEGRQRVKNAQEANVRLKASGLPTVLIACEVERGSDAFLASMSIALNEIRRPDDPLTRAKKMQRLLDMGQSPDQVGLAFGLSAAAVKHNLGLLELAPPVQKAVAAGELGPTRAVRIYRPLERTEQANMLQKERKAGTLGTVGPGRPTRRKRADSNGARPPSKKFVAALSQDKRLSNETRQFLAYVSGSKALTDLSAKHQKIAEAAS